MEESIFKMLNATPLTQSWFWATQAQLFKIYNNENNKNKLNWYSFVSGEERLTSFVSASFHLNLHIGRLFNTREIIQEIKIYITSEKSGHSSCCMRFSHFTTNRSKTCSIRKKNHANFDLYKK